MFKFSRKLIICIINMNFFVLSSFAMEIERVPEKSALKVMQSTEGDQKGQEAIERQMATLADHGSAAQPGTRKAIVWDLSETLIFADTYKIATEKLGLKNLLSYWFLGRKNPFKIKERANALLSTLGEQTVPDAEKLYWPEGFAASQLHVNLLAGLITQKEACEQATELVENLHRNGTVRAVGEKTALLSLMHLLFDYSELANFLKIDPQGIDLVTDSARNCEQYVLSNWPVESFNAFYESEFGQKLFHVIPRENCMVSGEQGMVKPNPALFQAFLEKYRLDPQDVLFIDDVLLNVEAAQRAGLNAIHFDKKMSYGKLRKALLKAGYLKPAVTF